MRIPRGRPFPGGAFPLGPGLEVVADTFGMRFLGERGGCHWLRIICCCHCCCWVTNVVIVSVSLSSFDDVSAVATSAGPELAPAVFLSSGNSSSSSMGRDISLASSHSQASGMSRAGPESSEASIRLLRSPRRNNWYLICGLG
ncbi:hypothetical protein PF006_g30333 [Phytophthora fragariae]|uniref:Uncharacterized protein n=1 Tax=Phytophthora fragariae TaxID=53985 RepID=A0A6A3PZS8_9STRA|nr:hypothetical protein PF006_g30333 [Phytophthora fragariae]